MAPEQILNDPSDGRTDIYATGVMLFEMLVSRLPLPKYSTAMELLKMRLKLKERLFQKKPSEMNPILTREMDDIVFKATAHDPENRYATCREFLEAIKVYRDHHIKTLH
jgi:serine/threonine-protein kinase